MTAADEIKRLRVAVAGCGEFGRNHTRVYREMNSAELVGVFDTDPVRAAGFAQEFNVQAFSSLQAMSGKVDAASVAVPTIAHAEVGCALMELGIDVLVEKPMAKDLADADRHPPNLWPLAFRQVRRCPVPLRRSLPQHGQSLGPPHWPRLPCHSSLAQKRTLGH